MHDLHQRIDEANNLLAPYAVRHEGPLGRIIAEEPDVRRFPFQRDCDRIVHTQAFRRLQGKTQVFVSGTGDHLRTRLTHTMEVSLVARDLTRSLRLNEDLAECIALAHDLGHPPFGHAGEEALDAWMRTQGSRFEHNEQSLRLVTQLEEHARGQSGLNLQREILDGLMKHTLQDRQHTLEAQLVNLADEIAYTAHDCDDALRAGLFTLEDIQHIPLIAKAAARAEERGTSVLGGIIKILAEDLLAHTEQRIADAQVRTVDDVREFNAPLAGFSNHMQTQLKEWREYLWPHMYMHPRVVTPMQEGQRLLLTLCQRLLENPSPRVLAMQQRTGDELFVGVKDYVAGMTDSFAYATGRELGLVDDNSVASRQAGVQAE